MTPNKHPGNEKLHTLLAIVVVLTAIFGVYYREIVFQHAFFIMDHSLQNYPFREYSAQQLRGGFLPLWCPYIGAGFPLFAEGQSGIFFPLNFVLSLCIAGWKNYSLQVILTFVLGSTGMTLYLRSLKLGLFPVIVGSLVWCLNGYMLTHAMFINFFQGSVLIPFILWLIELFRYTPSLRKLLIITLLTTFIILAGHPQLVLISLVIIAPYFWIRTANISKTSGNRIKWILIPLAGALIMGSIQILPTLELAADSVRTESWSPDRITEMSIPPHFLIHLLIPYYFGNPANNTYWSGNDGYFWEFSCYLGIFPLFLIPFAVKSRVLPAGLIRFFLFFLLVSLLLALGKYSVLFQVLARIPGYPFRIPARFLLLFVLSGSVLSAAGAQVVTAVRDKKSNRLFTITLAVIMSGIYAVVILLNKEFIKDPLTMMPELKSSYVDFITALTPYLTKQILVSIGFAVLSIILLFLVNIFLESKKCRKVCQTLFIILVMGDLVLVSHQYHTGITPDIFEKPSPFYATLKQDNQYRRVQSEILEHEISTKWHKGWKLSTDGYRLLYDGLWMYCNLPWHIPSTVIDGWSPYHPGNLIDLANKIPFPTLQMLATRYIILTHSTTVPGLIKIRETDTLTLYKIERGMPGIIVVNNLSKTQPEWVPIEMTRPGFNPATTAITGDISVTEYGTAVAPGKVVQEKWGDRDIEFRAAMDKPGMVFISTLYNSGWTANIDGTNTKVYRINDAFCGIYIDEGQHTVRLTFIPFSFKLGLFICCTGLMIAGFSLTIHNPHRSNLFSKIHFGGGKQHARFGVQRITGPWIMAMLFLILIGISIMCYPIQWQRSIKAIQPAYMQELNIDITNL